MAFSEATQEQLQKVANITGNNGIINVYIH